MDITHRQMDFLTSDDISLQYIPTIPQIPDQISAAQ